MLLFKGTLTTEYCCYVKESSVTNSRVRGLDYDSTCGIAVCTDGCMCACGMYVSWVLGCPRLCLSDVYGTDNFTYFRFYD